MHTARGERDAALRTALPPHRLATRRRVAQVGDLESKELHDASSNVTVVVAQHIHAAMRLESVQELRLSLLRHWSLLDAMNYSPYVATRLGLWSQKGRDNLHASRVDAR